MSAGYRSPAAPWAGGAAAAPVIPVGYFSLLAFWTGGAGVPGTVIPPVVVLGGGGGAIRLPVDRLRLQQLADDELIAIVIAAALPLLH